MRERGARNATKKNTARIRMVCGCNVGSTDWAYRLDSMCRRHGLINQGSGPAYGEALRLVAIVGMCRKYGIPDPSRIAAYAVAQSRPIMLSGMGHRMAAAFSPKASVRENPLPNGRRAFVSSDIRFALGDWFRDQVERISRHDQRYWDKDGRVLDRKLMFDLAAAGFSEPTVVEQVARLYAPEANRLRSGLNRIEAFVRDEVARLIAQPAPRTTREAGAA